MSDTKKLCLSVEPMPIGVYWEWRNHETRELFTFGMAATERGAFEAATGSVVEACNKALNAGRQEIEDLKKHLGTALDEGRRLGGLNALEYLETTRAEGRRQGVLEALEVIDDVRGTLDDGTDRIPDRLLEGIDCARDAVKCCLDTEKEV
jgi:hypothetical protein